MLITALVRSPVDEEASVTVDITLAIQKLERVILSSFKRLSAMVNIRPLIFQNLPFGRIVRMEHGRYT